MPLSVGYATMDFLKGGKGIAFGTTATKEGFECAMKAYFTGGVDGVAPAGYGLGSTSGRECKNCNTATANGFYSLAGANVSNGPGGYLPYGNLLVLNRYSNAHITQIAFFENAIAIRYYYESVWHAWEWVNPPMVIGTEYRTTERYNGKTVYAKWVPCGTMPASSTKTIQGVLNASYTVCELRGVAVNNATGAVHQLPAISDTQVTTARISILGGTTVYIATFTDMSAYSLSVLLKYIKD